MSIDQKKRPAKRKGGWGGARPNSGPKKKPDIGAPLPDGVLEAVPDLGQKVGHSEITDKARQYADVALRGAARIANSVRARPADVLKAADLILSWGYGKPLGIVSPARSPKSEEPPQGEEGAPAAAVPNEPKLGKKAALEQAAKNPDTSTKMGALLARRRGNLKVVGGDE